MGSFGRRAAAVTTPWRRRQLLQKPAVHAFQHPVGKIGFDGQRLCSRQRLPEAGGAAQQGDNGNSSHIKRLP